MIPLEKEVKTAREKIKTDSYSMSIGELINLYEKGELDIHPEFQRFFRWTESQKTNFIESIFLGIPIPPLFVAQSEDGIWSVVDGLQRLSTVFQFAGILKDEENKSVEPLILEKTRKLPSFENFKWENKKNPSKAVSQSLQLAFKRSRLDINIILEEGDSKVKYELFQRLNTGGTILSDQELRNCIIVSLDRSFFTWLKELSKNKDFFNTINLTEKNFTEQYDLELALRFIIFRKMDNKTLSKIDDVGNFLTDQMIDMIQNRQLDLKLEETVFKKTFEYINSILGVDAFKRYAEKKGRFEGSFFLSAFEAVAIGLGFYEGKIGLNEKEFVSKVKKLWSMTEFTKYSGSGIRASSRIPKLIPLGREVFKSDARKA